MAIDWQPIETCPDDGRPVLVYNPHWAKGCRIEIRGADGSWFRWAKRTTFLNKMPTHWAEIDEPCVRKEAADR